MECNETTPSSLDVREFLDVCLKSVVPLSRQGIPSEEESLEVCGWEDIGGLWEAKKRLKATILDPVRYRRIFERVPVRLPHGILLFGPPGCGKSYLVPALARECGYALVVCRGPEVLDKYIGASEAKVRRLFARARSAAPCILFLDELDTLAPRRGTDHTGVTDRIVNQLLTYLDGVEETSRDDDGRIYIVAATSRPDKIDPALLRPGRLEIHVHVNIPESEEERSEVLVKTKKSRLVDSHLQEQLDTGVLWREANHAPAEYFSPADVKAVWNTAYLNAIHEHIIDAREEHEPVRISLQHMISSIRSTKPSLSPKDRDLYEAIHEPFSGRSSGSQSRPDRQTNYLKTALK